MSALVHPAATQEPAIKVAPFGRRDWKHAKAILAEGLATGMAAFRLTPPLWRDWDAGHLSIGRLAARNPDGRMLGWTALSPVPDT